MPRILVLYFSQTGQLRSVLEHMLAPLTHQCDLSWAPIEPREPFAFPWTQQGFFDTMPETVAQIPVPLRPIPDALLAGSYDLVIFGMTPWFLHPSLPISSFLKSPQARALQGKKVVTVVGSRNMWLNAVERVKDAFKDLEAQHVGNIVLRDKHPNLLSLKSIDRWMFQGIKEATKDLPEAGIAQEDIEGAARFGTILGEALRRQNWQDVQAQILAAGGVELNAGLVLLEQRGVKNFRYWSRYIRERGGPGAPERQRRVRKFAWLLNKGVKILSPVSALSAAIQLRLKKNKLEQDVAYFKGVGFEEGRI